MRWPRGKARSRAIPDLFSHGAPPIVWESASEGRTADGRAVVIEPTGIVGGFIAKIFSRDGDVRRSRRSIDAARAAIEQAARDGA